MRGHAFFTLLKMIEIMAIDGQEGGVKALLESLLEETESRMVEYHVRSALQYHIAEQDGMILDQERPFRSEE